MSQNTFEDTMKIEQSEEWLKAIRQEMSPLEKIELKS